MTVRAIHAQHWKEFPSSALIVCVTENCTGNHIPRDLPAFTIDISALGPHARIVDYIGDIKEDNAVWLTNEAQGNAHRHDMDEHHGRGRVAILRYSVVHNTEIQGIQHCFEKLNARAWTVRRRGGRKRTKIKA